MLIHEVCKTCRLTKKAIEYYTEQELIRPTLLDNGYRDFSQDDIEILKKISVLRRLGLSVLDISKILNGQEDNEFFRIFRTKELEIIDLKKRQELLQTLAEKNDWDYTRQQLDALEQKQTILERLQNAFPGAYGQFISLHFAPFLGEPITTPKQQEAFNAIISFLDCLDFDIPEDLRKYLVEAVNGLDKPVLDKVAVSLNEAVQDAEKYMAKNKETIEWYMTLKNSDEYKQTPEYRLQSLFRQF